MELKRCPACKRTYSDVALSFCLVDGSILSPPYDPEATHLMPEARGQSLHPTDIIPAERITDEKPPATVPAAPQTASPDYARRAGLTKAQTIQDQAQLIQERERNMEKLVLGLIVGLLLVVFIIIFVNSN